MTANPALIADLLGEPDASAAAAAEAGVWGVERLPSGSALLVVKRGPNAGSRFLLDRPVTFAGRHPDSDIFLDEATVSRRHAEFRRENGNFRIVDIASVNGTYLNRKAVQSAVLANGDEIQIGKFRLVFLTRPTTGWGGGLDVEPQTPPEVVEMIENTPRSARRMVGHQTVSSPVESCPRRPPGHHMNHAPRGTVRRSAEGALLVREFRGDNEGWKLVSPQSELCAFFSDREVDRAWLDWPIIWCPAATFHEQDNIRRAQGMPAKPLGLIGPR